MTAVIAGIVSFRIFVFHRILVVVAWVSLSYLVEVSCYIYSTVKSGEYNCATETDLCFCLSV